MEPISIGIAIVSIVLFILILGFAFSRWYNRASKEVAFVRTGKGGERVIKDGGALVLPILHELIRVNMKTLPLMVERKNADALITKDKFRVDVGASFFVKVRPDTDGIATAAQTLGTRTMEPGALAAVVEDKLVDALRSTAAKMNMFELHEQRVEFVQAVQEAAGEDLSKNGLALESVSLTHLDQTDSKFLNPNNAFDAEGLRALAEITEKRRKERNAIEADTRVAVEEKNLEANERSLTIAQKNQWAELEQQREVETRRAQQEAQLATERAERMREAKLAEIEAEKATEEAEISRQRAIEEANINKRKALEIAKQDQEIAIATKSMERSKAQSEADVARAEAVEAEQAVLTAEEKAKAERTKEIALIEANTIAEEEATKIRVKAQADYDAAENKAKAIERLAQAALAEATAKATGEREINEAANILSQEQIDLKIRLALIERLPAIIEQMVKPIEKVDNVRVVHMTGGGFGAVGNGTGTGVEASGNIADQVTKAMLGYKMQSPIIDELARQVGVDLGDMNKTLESFSNPVTAETVDTDEAEG